MWGLFFSAEGYGEDDTAGKGLAYRLPGKANITVSRDSKELANKTLLIAQYGIIKFLPRQLLGQPDIMIRMHPELGSLEGIYEK